MTLNGIDVSQWQAADLSNVPLDFLVARVTHGNRFVDKWGDRHIQSAIKRGKLFGFYHFGANGMTPVQQADYFVDNCKGYFGKGIPVLDYENIGGSESFPSKYGAKGALEFLNRVHARTGVKPLIYCNAATVPSLGIVAAADYGLWVASWGSNAAGGYRKAPATRTAPWKFAAMQQYTSRGRLPGYNGDLDLDVFNGDKAAWLRYAGASSTPEPPSEPQGKTIEELAAEVWAGKHGNGEARKKSLGSNYAAVQELVEKQAAEKHKPTTYTVKRGDSLVAIARAHGTTVQAIQKKNGIANANLIYPGQVIKL